MTQTVAAKQCIASMAAMNVFVCMEKLNLEIARSLVLGCGRVSSLDQEMQQLGRHCALVRVRLAFLETGYLGMEVNMAE